jgi:hypothetical protein
MFVGRLAIAVLVAASLGSCSSTAAPTATPPTDGPERPLDGTYRVEIDGQRALRDGLASAETSATLDWAFRSDCARTCVAVAVPVSHDDPPQTGAPAAWDLEDGAWVKTVSGQLECGGAVTPTLETWRLRPAEGGALTGTRHLAFFGPTCGSVLEQFVTVRRIGEVAAAVHIPDPADQPALTRSVGAGLHGRYHKIQTYAGLEANPAIELTVATNCVRNSDHCLTYTVYEPPDKPRRVSGYQLTDGAWTSAVPYHGACPDGVAVRISVDTRWPLPEQPADPIPRVVGTQRDVYAEPCVRTVESQLVLERIGD